MKKVLILGGGFAGVQAAIDLQKSKKFDVTLVSNREFLYVFPLSIWIPVRGIHEDKVKISLSEIKNKHGFNLIIDEVSSVKSFENKVVCKQQILDYDYLMLAFGSDKIQMKGIENTLSLCANPNQALELRNRLDALIAKGKGTIAVGFGGNPKEKSAVRGGPAFEFIFNIDHYLRKKGVRKDFKLVMFAPMEKPGARMGGKALATMQKMFENKNIETHFGKKIVEFTPNVVVFEDNSTLDTDMTMFISAGTGSAILKNSDLPLSEGGFAKINDYCQVEGTENVYAIGDAASLEGPKWVAKQGHLAETMGANAAYNLIQTEMKTDKRKSYKEHLSILCVMDTGNGAAYVYRDDKKQKMITMPIVGHWLKQAWGVYTKAVKLKRFPKIV